MDDSDEHEKMKLYTLHTRATYEQVGAAMVGLTMTSKQVVFIEEQPNGYAVLAQRPVWTSRRWQAALGVLVASPLLFHFWHDATPTQAFGIGWLAAALVLSFGRRS